VGAFSLSLPYRDIVRYLCRPTACDEKGTLMAHVPWYVKIAELDTEHEREDFMRGVFGFRPKEKTALVTAVIAGYIAGKVATKAKRK